MRRVVRLIAVCVLSWLAWPAGAGQLPEADARAWVLELADRRTFDADAVSSLARHPAVEVRVAVARLLGELANPKASGQLEALGRDPDATVRRAAAQGAGRLGLALGKQTPASLRALLGRLLDDREPSVRSAAAWGLGAAFPEQAGEALLKRLATEPTPETQAALLVELWRLPDRGWVEQAGKRLASPQQPVRFAAAWSLSRSGAPEGLDAVRSAARDSDGLVRATALSWARRGDAGSLWDELVAGLADGDARVRIAALDGLAAALDKAPDRKLPAAALEAVTKLLTVESFERVQERFLAVRVAGRAKVAQKELETLAAGSNAWLAAEALAGLARLPGGVERLRSVLDTPKDARRVLVMRAALTLPGREALVVRGLQDSEAEVRLAAAEAASGLATVPEVGAALRERLDDTDVAVRAAALDALKGSPAEPAVDELVNRLIAETASPEPDVAVGILEILGGGKDLQKDVRDTARALLGAANPVIARAAWAVLAKHSDLRPLPPVSTRLDRAFYRKVVDWAAKPRWLEVVTVRGTLQIALDTESTPLVSYRVAELADRKFFENVVIHRVVPDFVVQGGDPRGDGWGGPGFSLRDEVCLEQYDAGAVGMALSGPDTGGSQLFVTLTPQPHLVGRYPRLGRLANGLDVAERLGVGDRIVRARAGEGPLPEYFPIWYGDLDPARLDAGIASWRKERENYKPKPELLDRLASAKLRYELTVAMGTWCGDSREQIPRLQAILAALGARSPFKEMRLIGIDRSKQAPASWRFGAVEKVPTIAVSFGGAAIGSIVETPASGTLEQDLVNILGSLEGWEPAHE
jgi:cyclophilin family peptidyl-prolyl cis-trans isomerase/HEAT repeat protein